MIDDEDHAAHCRMAREIIIFGISLFLLTIFGISLFLLTIFDPINYGPPKYVVPGRYIYIYLVGIYIYIPGIIIISLAIRQCAA